MILQSCWHTGWKFEPKGILSKILHQGHCVEHASISKESLKYPHSEWLRCIWTPALSRAQTLCWDLGERHVGPLGSQTSASQLNFCLYLSFETIELSSLVSLISWWQQHCAFAYLSHKSLSEKFARKVRDKNPHLIKISWRSYAASASHCNPTMLKK